jgi:hypothetical protein
MMARHAYAVREVAEGLPDPGESEYPNLSPNGRLFYAASALQLAVRRQLRVPNAEDVLDARALL